MTWHIHLHQLRWGHNQTPTVASDMKGISYRRSFITCNNQRKLLTSWIVFAVNRYECFIENKNKVRIFCGCKPSIKKQHWASSKFTGFFKKREGSGLTPKYTEYQNQKRCKKSKKLRQKLSEQRNMKFIN